MRTLLIPQCQWRQHINEDMYNACMYRQRGQKAIRYKSARQTILASRMNSAETSEATFGSRALVHPQWAKGAKAEIEQGRLKNILAMHAHLPLQYRHSIFRNLTHWHSSGFNGVSREPRLPARDVREEVTTEVTTGLGCNGRTFRRR